MPIWGCVKTRENGLRQLDLESAEGLEEAVGRGVRGSRRPLTLRAAMALFEFELAPTETIIPWTGSDGPSLSWFALTDGWFHMPVGDQVLFEYTDEILDHWRLTREGQGEPETRKYPDYQITAFVRDVLGSFAAGIGRLPPFFEELALDWRLLRTLLDHPDQDDTALEESYYSALRWLGERAPWMSYLAATQKFWFLRIGDSIHVRWNNRGKAIDDIPVWSAQEGVFEISVSEFEDECRSFADGLLQAMEARIDALEAGREHAQIPLDIVSLRRQHQESVSEFAAYFRGYEPDIPWDEAEAAIRDIAKSAGLELPSVAV